MARISGIKKIVEETKTTPVKEVKIEPKIQTQIDTKKVVLKPVKVENKNKTTKKIKVTRKKKK